MKFLPAMKIEVCKTRFESLVEIVGILVPKSYFINLCKKKGRDGIKTVINE